MGEEPLKALCHASGYWACKRDVRMMMEKEQNESALLILGLEVHVGGNNRHTIPRKSKKNRVLHAH
jgi:hypothetical protein